MQISATSRNRQQTEKRLNERNNRLVTTDKTQARDA